MSDPPARPARYRRGTASEWRRQPERGSFILLRVMACLSLRLGRPAGRLLLYGIAGYFFAFAPLARRRMRDYLRRALGRAPRAGERFRLLMNFASVVHDRLYLLAGRYDQFDVSLHGEALIRETVGSGEGAFLMGAHVGSFEVLRVIGERQPGLAVTMVMYEDNARKVNAILAAAAPRDPPEIIALGHLDAMLRIRARLDQGALVGVLADRTLGDEPSLAVSFLGATAHFPIGPMRAAAVLRRRVVFMLGLYRGGNRYHAVFEPLADFSATPPAQIDAAIESAITRYAGLLEQYCRRDPYNWFNFFDFWGTGAGAAAHRAGRIAAAAWLAALAAIAVPAERAAAAAPPAAASTAAPLAPAAAGELDRLMALLSQRRHGEADFQQRQYLSLLKQPLESSGVLIYDAPDHLEQRTLRPRQSTVVLERGLVTLQTGTHRRTLRLAEHPQLAPLIDSIRATLAGDRAALERVFTLRMSGGLERWQLQLEPRDAQLAARLERIEICGERDAVREVRVQQRDGDRSVMSIAPRE